MNAYSKDLRFKILAALDCGIPRKEVAELFGISLSTIKRWLKRKRLTGDVDIYKIPGRPFGEGRGFEGAAARASEVQSRPDLVRALQSFLR